MSRFLKLILVGAFLSAISITSAFSTSGGGGGDGGEAIAPGDIDVLADAAATRLSQDITVLSATIQVMEAEPPWFMSFDVINEPYALAISAYRKRIRAALIELRRYHKLTGRNAAALRNASQMAASVGIR